MVSDQATMAGSGLRQRLLNWAVRVDLARRLAIALIVAAVVSGIATYAAMSGIAPFSGNPRNVFILLNIDLVLLLLLGAVVAMRLVRLWLERRRGSAGSRLHTRMVALFSLVAVTPAILVAVFSALFLNFGVQAWFSTQVSTALDRSLVVAEAYLHEHRETIRADALAMANDLNRQVGLQRQNPYRFSQLVDRLAELRSLTEAVVLTRQGRILARSGLSFSLAFARIPEPAMRAASEGEVIILATESDDRVRALVRLDSFVDAYLFVGRFIASAVISDMQRVQGAVRSYKQLEQQQSGIRITFVLIFVVVALLMLLAAVWMGLTFANQLVRPIGNLISAAERVRAGELSARVPEGDPADEIGTLSRAFNRMTGQLQSQRQDLVAANEQLDDRRRFTEAVLSGVSAGVIGLDARGQITLPNPSALELLHSSADDLAGRTLEAEIPEMGELLEDLRARPARPVEGQIELVRGGRKRTLLVRMVAEREGAAIDGFVVTFDDITPLVAAQRTAAWADVARRIAHEIKNPLTPIQLSAERLKRKYLGEIKSEPEAFTACTDTIVRQVGDIRRMVDEFSSFARMPAPVMRTEDLRELTRQAVLMQRVAQTDIVFEIHAPEEPVSVQCDARQIGQSLTNLLKNAVEAVNARPAPASGTLTPGRVEIRVRADAERHVVEIEDNGPGLPLEQREHLTEPYVTTRERGTGLGLAIVQKIMEDHGGQLILSNGAAGGACISLVFGRQGGAAPETAGDDAAARRERG